MSEYVKKELFQDDYSQANCRRIYCFGNYIQKYLIEFVRGYVLNHCGYAHNLLLLYIEIKVRPYHEENYEKE